MVAEIAAQVGIRCSTKDQCHVGESPILYINPDSREKECLYCGSPNPNDDVWDLQDGLPVDLCSRRFNGRKRFCPCTALSGNESLVLYLK